MNKVYIAGKITNCPNFKANFAAAEKDLIEQGYLVMNPAILPEGFEWHEYMRICFAMIDACDIVYFLPNWKESKGAIREKEYAENNKKHLIVPFD